MKWHLRVPHIGQYESLQDYFRNVSVTQAKLLKNKGYSEGVVGDPLFPCYTVMTSVFCLCVGGLTEDGNKWAAEKVVDEMKKIYYKKHILDSGRE